MRTTRHALCRLTDHVTGASTNTCGCRNCAGILYLERFVSFSSNVSKCRSKRDQDSPFFPLKRLLRFTRSFLTTISCIFGRSRKMQIFDSLERCRFPLKEENARASVGVWLISAFCSNPLTALRHCTQNKTDGKPKKAKA